MLGIFDEHVWEMYTPPGTPIVSKIFPDKFNEHVWEK